MIERKDVMPINFLKKENFTGSYKGMRYRMEKVSGADGETVLCVVAWPEPYGYVATSEEVKIRNTFPFTEEGIVSGVEWLNEQHTKFR